MNKETRAPLSEEHEPRSPRTRAQRGLSTREVRRGDARNGVDGGALDRGGVGRGSGPPRLIRWREVVDKTGVPRPTIYLKMRAGEFPLAIPLGDSTRAVAWREDEID